MHSKRIIWLIVAVLAAAGLFAYMKLSPEPNTELKATHALAPNEIEPAATKTIEAALAAIKAKNAKKLLAIMANRDEVMLESYTEDLFKGGDFMPAEISSARKNEKSSLGAIMVIVHSQPRAKDYEFMLVQRKGKYLLEGIRRQDSNQ